MNTIYDAKLLLVDDNPDLLRLLCEQLTSAGYRSIRTAANCAAAKAAFEAETPELMVLDINLPDGDGFSLFRALRGRADVPALFLSARDADADRLFGLGLGADDYLTKPFVSKEFLARVRALCRRRPLEYLSRALSFSDISLDSSRHELQCGERRVKLSQKEYDMMEMLLLNHGQIIPKESFLTKIWGYDSNAEYNSIEVYVSFLRKKLTALHSGVKIKIVRGVGYYLEGASDAAGN